MSTLAADLRPSVLDVLNADAQLTESQIWDALNDGHNDRDEVNLALMRLASDGRIKRGDDDRWSWNDPDLSDRPAWADRTYFDHDGSVLNHEATLGHASRVSVDLIQEVQPPAQLLHFVQDRQAFIFHSIAEARAAAELLTTAVQTWERIEAGEQ